MQLAAVILAAGNGSRLGGVAKALIRLDGVPLVRRLIAALQGAGITDVVVVTGTHHEAIAAAVAPSTARLVRNTDAALGQPGSVRLGLQSTDPRADAVMVLLADQALLTAGDLRDLVAAFGYRSGEAFVVPRVDGALRGNPVMVSLAAVQTILQSTQHRRRLEARHQLQTGTCVQCAEKHRGQPEYMRDRQHAVRTI